MTEKKKLTQGKFGIEGCDPGMQNCVRIVESIEAKESHEVSAENYWYMGLSRSTLDEIYDKMRLIAQSWIGNEIDLAGTSIYGIRRYTRGATLLAHLDHLKSHVISAIMNIKQKVDKDWPLQILDHDGNMHEVLLKPGEMVWYESSRLIHARSKPLNGSYFENIFIHYMPRSQFWYKDDYDINYGEPEKLITLEDLKRENVNMLSVEKEIIEKREIRKKEEEERLQKMTLEEKLSLSQFH